MIDAQEHPPACSARARVEQVLPPEGRSAGLARRLVGALCGSWSVDEGARDTAVLLTSEAVTNAVIHGRSEVRLSVEVTAERIRVAVADDNSRHPRLQPQDAGALDGRGLQILELAASSWGVEEQPLGKVVWFVVDLLGPVAAPSAGAGSLVGRP